ncbi:MAG: hypothetical protein HQL31_01340 [Planctomycetes bacterium]|nr:hypothetical protein [Planctomycetota bacterium]
MQSFSMSDKPPAAPQLDFCDDARLRLVVEEVIKAVRLPTEYITMEEAAAATGFKETYIRDLAKKAGITRIGNRAFDREEFFMYWRHRTRVEDEPKVSGENSKQRLDRINKSWRFYGSKEEIV